MSKIDKLPSLKTFPGKLVMNTDNSFCQPTWGGCVDEHLSFVYVAQQSGTAHFKKCKQLIYIYSYLETSGGQTSNAY